MSRSLISDDQLDELGEKVANDDSLMAELISLRGGCSCHVSPPCAACVNPLTADEAISLGIFEEPEGLHGEHI
jgi:hypothetical protein